MAKGELTRLKLGLRLPTVKNDLQGFDQSISWKCAEECLEEGCTQGNLPAWKGRPRSTESILDKVLTAQPCPHRSAKIGWSGSSEHAALFRLTLCMINLILLLNYPCISFLVWLLCIINAPTLMWIHHWNHDFTTSHMVYACNKTWVPFPLSFLSHCTPIGCNECLSRYE